MEMQVLDGLAGLIAAVIDDAVALAAQFLADLGDDFKDMGHQRAVLGGNLAGAADMLLVDIVFRDPDIVHIVPSFLKFSHRSKNAGMLSTGFSTN